MAATEPLQHVKRNRRAMTGQSGRRTLILIALLLGAGAAVSVTRAANYVFPEYEFGQSLVASLLFLGLLVAALAVVIRRLLQKRFAQAVAVLAALVASIWLDGPGAGAYWKFLLHRSEYRAIVAADETISPKYRVFSWGNKNTQLWGGGVIFEAIVYDELDQIGRAPEFWSVEWLQRRRLDTSKENSWITEIRKDHPGCTRTVRDYGAHFYFVSEEC